MRRFLLLLFTLLAALAHAQTPGQSTDIRTVTTLPASCDPSKGEFVFLFNVSLLTAAPYYCDKPNHWSTFPVVRTSIPLAVNGTTIDGGLVGVAVNGAMIINNPTVFAVNGAGL